MAMAVCLVSGVLRVLVLVVLGPSASHVQLLWGRRLLKCISFLLPVTC